MVKRPPIQAFFCLQVANISRAVSRQQMPLGLNVPEEDVRQVVMSLRGGAEQNRPKPLPPAAVQSGS